MKKKVFDLIFSGLQSDDTGMGQTGVLIGEMLGISTATLAIKIKIQDNAIKIKRELESGWFQWITLPFPASVSIQSGLNNPRYPSLKGIMSAKKKEIKVIQEADHYSENLNQEIEKIFIPKTNKKTEIIDGDVDSTVTRIIEILKSEIKVI